MFEVGDYVIVKKGLRVGMHSDGFHVVQNMVDSIGKKMKITNEIDKRYQLNDGWFYKGYMIEKCDEKLGEI